MMVGVILDEGRCNNYGVEVGGMEGLGVVKERCSKV